MAIEQLAALRVGDYVAVTETIPVNPSNPLLGVPLAVVAIQSPFCVVTVAQPPHVRALNQTPVTLSADFRSATFIKLDPAFVAAYLTGQQISKLDV